MEECVCLVFSWDFLFFRKLWLFWVKVKVMVVIVKIRFFVVVIVVVWKWVFLVVNEEED